VVSSNTSEGCRYSNQTHVSLLLRHEHAVRRYYSSWCSGRFRKHLCLSYPGPLAFGQFVSN
jgi:hypothetical protein